MKELRVIGSVIAIIIVAVVIGPAIMVWSINELAEQADQSWRIEWGFWTWLACACLLSLFSATSKA